MSEAEGPTGLAGAEKSAQAGEVLEEIFKLMGIRARLDVKDVPAREAEPERPATPASISVALHLEEDVPGIAPGKRSQIVDSVQFLANKIVNRGQDKRWINIGIGAHPEPRVPGQKPPKPAPQAKQPAPSQPAPAAPPSPRAAKAEAKAEARPKRPAPAVEDESQLEAADDAAIQRLGRLLAEKSAQFGRHFGVFPMAAAERMNLTRGSEGVAGTSVKTEGEGRHRRVVFVPANPKPMPKKSALPDYDDEDEDDDESGD
jgi:predicted RNA-binding protein Jag